MFIYVIRNSATGKIYIGQHKGVNLKQYLQKKLYAAIKGLGGKSHLFSSMRKHPREVWSIEPLMEADTREKLNRLETLLIALYDTRNPEVGYNICKGGEGFTGKHSDEWKKAQLRWMTGRPCSKETRAKISLARTGNLSSSLAAYFSAQKIMKKA